MNNQSLKEQTRKFLRILANETLINVDAETMIKNFQTAGGHSCTYPGERDASFSANSNVLKTFLEFPSVEAYTSDINHVTTFLCDLWWAGITQDKRVSTAGDAFEKQNRQCLELVITILIVNSDRSIDPFTPSMGR